MKKLTSIFIFLIHFTNISLKAQQLSLDTLFTEIHDAQTLEKKYDISAISQSQANAFHQDQNDLDSLIQILQQLSRVALNNRDTFRLAGFLYMKAAVLSAAAQHDSSIIYLNEAIKYYTLLKDKKNISNCYLWLCIANQRLYHFNTAVYYLNKCIEISTQIGDTETLFNANWHLSRLYFDRKQEPGKTLNYVRKNVSSDINANLVPFSFIAELFLRLHQPDSAIYYLDKVRPVTKNGIANQIAYFCRANGLYYQYVGTSDSASYYFLKAIDYLKEARQEHNSAQCFYYLGEVASQMNNFSLAEKYYKTAETYAIQYNRLFLLPDIYFELSKVYRKNHKPENAYSIFNNYKVITDSLKKIEATDMLIALDLQHQFSLKEKQMIEEKLKKEFEIQTMVKQKEQTLIYTVSGVAALLLIGAYGFYAFRKQKKLENQQALSNERLRISRDLHDDMGASLSSISVFSSAVKQKLLNNETQEAEQLLDRMSTDAQEMVSSMSEMVWTISPHNDTIEKLTDRLQVYAAAMLSAKNISFRLESDEELKNKKLPVDMRKNIFLILKEAINNASKYSDAAEVKLTVCKKENRFVAVLADNGKGFDISAQRNKNGEAGNGLKNMHQRADEIQSQIEINSEVNKGTSVTFVCSLPKIGED